MAQALIDITGNEYGFLRVKRFSHIGNRRRSYWECECLRCGKTVTLRKDHFAYPYSRQKSCGCWHPEESSIRAKNSQNKVTGKFERINLTEKEVEAEEIMNHYDEGCKKWSKLFAEMK